LTSAMTRPGNATCAVLLSFLCPFSPRTSQEQPENDYSKPIMTGISNQGLNRNQPYVTAGDRIYVIGTQDGNFPDMEGHVPGEMGGLWLHPIKLIEGFWAKVKDVATGHETPLSEAAEFINYPFGNLFRYP